MAKRMAAAVGALLLLLLIIFGAWGIKVKRAIDAMKASPPPSAVISSGVAQSKNYTPRLTTVGSLEAEHGVNVNSQVAGQITAISFKSGQRVEKGDLLVQLDDRVDQQQLNSFEAQLAMYQSAYDRQSSLFVKQATAASALDQAVSNLKQAKANVAKEKTLISQKHITAPFAGKLGIKSINVGQYVQAGASMVPLQALNPLFVNFSLPEQDLSKLKTGQRLTIKVDGYPNQSFVGKITAISSEVDVQTRSILVQGTIPNPKFLLLPGSYAEVTVYLPLQKKVTVIPNTAVTYRLYGDAVFVITSDKSGKKAEQRYVTVGDAYDSANIIIKNGVKPGDAVVTSGQLKLHSGMPVKINNSVKLKAGSQKVQG